MIDYAHERCRACPCEEACPVTRPAERAEIAVVFDAATDRAVKRDAYFADGRGGTGVLVAATLKAAGVDPEEVYVCSALNCRPPSKKKPMLNKAMNACRERLVRELKTAGVQKVLCLGPIGYSALTSLDKVAAPTNVRGRWRQAYGMQVMGTVPPSFVYGNRDFFRDFAHDVERFATTDGPEPEPDIELWIPETLAEVDEAFDWLEEYDWLSCDLETTGFSPISDHILAAGFGALSGRHATVVIVDEGLMSKKKAWRRIGQLLNDSSIELAFHGGKFDLQFLKQGMLERSLRYAPASIHDTMLLHYLIDERPMGKMKSHGLERLARVRYDAPDYGINMGKFLEEWEVAPEFDRREMRQALHIYLGLDCYYTARLFPDLWNEAYEEDPDLLDVYADLLIPGSIALADVEHRGILIDTEMFRKSRDKLEKKAKRLEAKLQRDTGIPDFNPGSPQQVKKLIYEDLGLPYGLRTEGGKTYHTARRGGLQEGPTAAPVLKGLAYRFPEHKQLVDDICEYRNLTKNIGTYVNGLLTRVDPADDRIRSSFNLHGTATGRLSSSDPNLQNVPDASHTGIEIRGGFIASPGCVLIEADYKQLEVRIAAWLSDDDAMRSVFESGRDPHQEIAFSIYRKPKEEITHYMRWLAKNILFGLLYGRGYESVATGPEQEDIAARGGQRWDIDDVREFYSNLLGEWADFAAWQENQRRLGYKQGYIKTPVGRRKRFPFIPSNDAGYVGRASFNNPIQSVASDFTLYALIRLHATLPEGAWVVSTVHDSLIIECEKTLEQEVRELIQRTMEEDTLFEIDVPLEVDIDVSERWGEKDQLAHVPIMDADV